VIPLQVLSGILKNVDVNAVGAAAETALSGLRREMARLDTASVAERQLIELVVDKFAGLTSEADPSGRYDRGYFAVQLEMARMLLAHGFLVQAFTVLRETLAAVGMIGLVGTKSEVSNIDSSSGSKARRNYGEVFVCMLQYPVAAWSFSEQSRGHVEELRPFFNKLMGTDTGVRLKDSVQRLVKIRNGFDHAWTSASPGERPTPESLSGLTAEGEELRVLLVTLVGEVFSQET